MDLSNVIDLIEEIPTKVLSITPLEPIDDIDDFSDPFLEELCSKWAAKDLASKNPPVVVPKEVMKDPHIIVYDISDDSESDQNIPKNV